MQLGSMWPETHSRTTPDSTMARISAGEYPEAYMAAMIDPMEVPAVQSTGIPFSSSASSTPMW